MISTVKNNLLIILILLVAFFFRFYNLDKLATFGGDQGYDFEQIRNIVVDKNPTLLGPKIGPYNQFGNLYLGPAYYYLLLPSLILFNFDPLGPEIFTIIISILMIYFTYLISLKYFNKFIAINSAVLIAINPFLINQSRTASNPHLTPFFTAIAILCLFNTIKEKSIKKIWPFINGICCGIIFQLHYLGLILITFCLIVILARKKKFAASYIAGLILSLLPQIIFEFRHNFFITNLVIRTIRDGNNFTSIRNILIHLFVGLSNFSELMFGKGVNVTAVLIFCLIMTILFCLKNKKKEGTIVLLTSLLFFVFVGAAFYSASIQPHYLVIGYVPIAIILSLSIYQCLMLFKNPVLKTMCALAVLQIYISSVLAIDLNARQGYTMPEGWNQEAIRKTSRIIASDANLTANFNIASTLDGDTRAMPYRYLVKVYGASSQPVESYPVNDVLYLITRDDNTRVFEYTVWEVFSMRPFRMSNEWLLQNGIRLVKLERQNQ